MSQDRAFVHDIINIITMLHLFKKPFKFKILAEITIIVASVFVFRGIWLLLDIIPFMSEPLFLALFVLIGIGVIIPAVKYLLKN